MARTLILLVCDNNNHCHRRHDFFCAFILLADYQEEHLVRESLANSVLTLSDCKLLYKS